MGVAKQMEGEEGQMETYTDGDDAVRVSVVTRTLVALSGILIFILLAMSLEARQAAAATCTDSLQAKIDATPAGGTVTAEGCIYRERIEIDKPITILGNPGAQIRGSDVWTGWEKRSDGKWVSTQSVPAFPETMDQIVCMPNTSRCHWPEQVFVNGKALYQVASKPGPGQFAINPERRVVLTDDPRQHLVEVTTRREWVVGTGSADDVIIDNVGMRHAANSGRTAALLNRPSQTDSLGAGTNWTVKNSTLSDAHGAIVSLKGGATGHAILDNRIMRAGQIGIHGAADGSIIRGNEIAFGNTEKYCYMVSCGTLRGIGETGGVKLAAYVDDTVFTDNHVHDNYGHGIHYDAECSNNTISYNRVHDNARHGIQYELCYSGKIFGNVVYNNGWATPDQLKGVGIALISSSSTEVYRNTLAWNADGITVHASDREGTSHDLVHHVYIHDNTILSSNGQAEKDNGVALAWVQGTSTTLFDAVNRNRGANNRYWYTSPEGSLERFRWQGSISKLAAFNRTRGEEGGRYLSKGEKDRLVANKGIPPTPKPR